MKTKPFLISYHILFFLLLSPWNIFAQGNHAFEWKREQRIEGSTTNELYNVTVDSKGNSYVTGLAQNAPDSKTQLICVTVKYDPNGKTLWTAKWIDSFGLSTYGERVRIDKNGNVLIFATTDKHALVLIKYSPEGELLWHSMYSDDSKVFKMNSRGNGQPNMCIDLAGNIYLSQYFTNGKNLDYLTLKYNPAGHCEWKRFYNGPANADDLPQAMTLDRKGNIYILGTSYDSIIQGSMGPNHCFPAFALVEYSPSGDLLWTERYSNHKKGGLYAAGINVDTIGNVYITGSPETWNPQDGKAGYPKVLVLKYDSKHQQKWVSTFDGKGLEFNTKTAVGVLSDKKGDVFVSCFTGGYENNSTACGFATVKYDANGKELWEKYYLNPSMATAPKGMAMDGAGNVYVTGELSSVSAPSSYLTIKYTSEGKEDWVGIWDDSSKSCTGLAIAVSNKGDVFVTGVVRNAWEYAATLKYGNGSSPANSNKPAINTGTLPPASKPEEKKH